MFFLLQKKDYRGSFVREKGLGVRAVGLSSAVLLPLQTTSVLGEMVGSPAVVSSSPYLQQQQQQRLLLKQRQQFPYLKRL